MSWNYCCDRCGESLNSYGYTVKNNKTIQHYCCPKCNRELNVTHTNPKEEWKN